MQDISTPVYQEWLIEVTDPEQREILIAQLSEMGFDGFEERPGNLAAYGSKESIDKTGAEDLLRTAGWAYVTKELQHQNWNALWESSFEPVIIGDFCRIHAHFHPVENGYTHQICITPKMSFGTGHHATTRMMIRMMEKLDFPGKRVLDFGAGTGVLAILAEKLGAASVLAIENDPGAIENAFENVVVNQCNRVIVRAGSLEISGSERFDLVLANINRNILLQYASALSDKTASGGQLLLSGILKEDVQLIQDAFRENKFQFQEALYEGNWACLRFIKTTIF